MISQYKCPKCGQILSEQIRPGNVSVLYCTNDSTQCNYQYFIDLEQTNDMPELVEENRFSVTDMHAEFVEKSESKKGFFGKKK